jgi:methylglutaconyl-CoA hydratase
MVQYQYLSYQADGPIAQLQFQHPSGEQVLNYQVLEELQQALQQAENDEHLKAIRITSAADHFCLGMDAAYLQQLQNFGVDENNADSSFLAQVLTNIKRHKKLILAEVSGLAEGEGCALAAACDFVLADDNARFRMPDAQYGNIPAISIYFLLGRLQQGPLRKLLLKGETYGPATATAWGLVDEYYTAEALAEAGASNLAEAGNAWAHTLVRLNARGSVEFTKKMIQDLAIMPFQEGLNFAAKINAHARSTIEFQRGLQARQHNERLDW